MSAAQRRKRIVARSRSRTALRRFSRSIHSEQTINKGARRQSMGDHWKISELPAEATEAHELDHWRNNNSIRGDNTNGADWMNCVAPNSLHCFHRVRSYNWLPYPQAVSAPEHFRSV